MSKKPCPQAERKRMLINKYMRKLQTSKSKAGRQQCLDRITRYVRQVKQLDAN